MSVHTHFDVGFTLKRAMLALHTVLTQAGWTREFISNDARNTGTDDSPSWDRPISEQYTILGTVVYRMPPTDGQLTQWYLRIQPGTNGGDFANYPLIIFTSALGVDTRDGTLTSPGSRITVLVNSLPANAANLWVASAYESGVLLAFNGNPAVSSDGSVRTALLLNFERTRQLDGTVMDDVTTIASSVNFGLETMQVNGTAVGSGAGISIARNASNGEYPYQQNIVLTSLANASNPIPPASLNRSDDSTGVLQGPFTIGTQGLSGTPRLFCFLAPSDTPPNSDVLINADGDVRRYLATPYPPVTAQAAIQRIAYAKE